MKACSLVSILCVKHLRVYANFVGESVPVTKTPATTESLSLLDLSASSIASEAAKHFLFSGTKIIRARRPQDGQDDEAVALAIVVRTGFNTTQGALVRSMLFPKPSGFKFYKDAFRYISVMAGVAGVGFFASFINFVELGVGPYLSVFVSILTPIARMEFNHRACLGSNYNNCASCLTCHINHWNEFCIVTIEVKKYFLYQPAKAGLNHINKRQ
jgi:hypothetical protein